MSITLTSTRLKFLDELAYLPRVTMRDGRAIEQALAGPDLLQPGVQVRGAIVEASLAQHDSGLLKRLHESGVQYLVDAQVLRFADASYQQVDRIAALPFAPRAAITTGWDVDKIGGLVRGVFAFQDEHGASARLAIAPPLRDESFEQWLDLHNRMLDASIALNGRGGFERKPLLAYLAPGRYGLANRDAVLARLADLPLDGVYVQPLRLSPTTYGIEKLVSYIRLLTRLEGMGLPAVAGRVGAFGLALLALGARAFDSGLGEAERFSFADLVRRRSQESRDARGPQGSRRVYLEPLKTTLRSRDAEAVLSRAELRSHFTCNLGCCRFRGFEGLAGRARQHYLWVKTGEAASLASASTRAMRIEHVHRGYREARDLSTVVARVLGEHELAAPDFEHLDRWLGVLSRSAAVLHEAA